MRVSLFLAVATLAATTGCSPGILWAHKRAEVTAVSFSACDEHGKPQETGIPFYLPKPLLIVAKNFRNIEEAKTGVTDSAPIPTVFDDQAKYADLNARTNFVGLQSTGTTPQATDTGGSGGAGNKGGDPAPGAPPGTPQGGAGSSVKSGPYFHSGGPPVVPGAAPEDGLTPNVFYTYQIVFIPDMTQKFGLKVKGGAGEFRAAMNLVNGWQFTGLGPYYIKDSSTAQNILASGISARLGGQAVADVTRSIADLARAARAQGGDVNATDPQVKSVTECFTSLGDMCVQTIPAFAEIHVYEPHVEGAMMEWREITNLQFSREYLGHLSKVREYFGPPMVPGAAPVLNPQRPGGQAGDVGGSLSIAVGGIRLGAAALPPQTQAGEVGGAVSAPAAGSQQQQQQQVNVIEGGKGIPAKEFNMFRFGGGGHKQVHRGGVVDSVVSGALGQAGAAIGRAPTVPGNFTPPSTPAASSKGQGGDVGVGQASGAPLGVNTTIINQSPVSDPRTTPPNAGVPFVPPVAVPTGLPQGALPAHGLGAPAGNPPPVPNPPSAPMPVSPSPNSGS